MTDDHFTALLAERVMAWSVAPDRFLLGGRRWLPRWRFRPFEKLDDAFQLLEKAGPEDYLMGDDGKGFWVRIRIGKTIAEARDISKPRAITLAVARAVGIEAEQ
jgi:hypothetical protein